MKKSALVLSFFALLFALLFACQSGPDKTEMAAQITTLQQEIGAAAQPAPEKLEALHTAYQGYAAAFPKDSLSAKYLSNAGETASLMGRFDEAIAIYDKIIGQFPDSKEATGALFMKAFTLDNNLKKYPEAKAVYEEFVQKYPNDEFADDAQFLLKNLGKSPEEIIKGFEGK
ncbi:MAG: tetratricopeptide repeat protein [Bacteroidetes bacterium]|nr:tetratricopeptide repeat protein [Bacteroidota bacterium]